MPLHVVHLAVKAGIEPAQQMLLVLGDLDTCAHAELAEAAARGRRAISAQLGRVQVKNVRTQFMAWPPLSV